MFISFEGLDGCGKTTQVALLRRYLEEKHFSVLQVREPGGTKLGEAIRKLLLWESEPMTVETEALLFMASRAQLCAQVIRPALAAGKIVICDRFLDSSVAYQGVGRGLGTDRIKQLNMFATRSLKPDITFLLDLPPARSFARVAGRAGPKDRIEQASETEQDFAQRIRQAFLALAEEEPERIKIIDASGDKHNTQAQVRRVLSRVLPADGFSKS